MVIRKDELEKSNSSFLSFRLGDKHFFSAYWIYLFNQNGLAFFPGNL